MNVSVKAVIASGPETLRSSQVGDAAATAAPAAGREARAVAMAATLGACPCVAASARPVAACATIAGRLVTMGLDAIRRAQTGGVRPPPGVVA